MATKLQLLRFGLGLADVWDVCRETCDEGSNVSSIFGFAAEYPKPLLLTSLDSQCAKGCAGLRLMPPSNCVDNYMRCLWCECARQWNGACTVSRRIPLVEMDGEQQVEPEDDFESTLSRKLAPWKGAVIPSRPSDSKASQQSPRPHPMC